MKNFINLSLFVLTLVSCGNTSNKAIDNSEPSIIGKWYLKAVDKEYDAVLDVYFNILENGTAIVQYLKNSEQVDEDVKLNSSQNGDNIYLYKEDEPDNIAIYEIISLDVHSLVVHVKGQPDDALNFYTKRI